jgi:hypothetical protein
VKSPKDLIKQAFENTPTVFQALSRVRTRRVGEGYNVAPGEEDQLPLTGKVKLNKGPLAFKSQKKPVPLSDVENALLCWAACGPNGMAMLDLDPNNDLSTALSFAGRTIPGPCNDLGAHLFYCTDEGTFFYKPSLEASKPVEIEGDDDYEKILDWFKKDSVKISDKRIDLDWGSPEKWGPAGKGALTGIWQYNFNRPGSTVFFPVVDVTKEMVNVMLSGFEYMHWLFVDDETGEPMGISDWAMPGYLEVPVPWSMYEEIILTLEHCVAGMMVQNARLAAEAMGLGHWNFGGIAEDMILGGMPELAKGLGFNFQLINGRNFFQGLPGIWEGWGWPSPWFKSTDEIIEKNVQLRYSSEGQFFGKGCSEGCIDSLPFNKETRDAIRQHPKIKISDWAIDAAKSCIKYIVNKYGRFPVYCSPFHAQFVCQFHHIDPAFYEKYYVPGYIHDRIINHFRDWH